MTAHVSIKMLHAWRLAALEPRLKAFATAQEAVIFAPLHRHAAARRPLPQHIQHTPLTRLCHHHLGRSMSLHRALQLASQRAAVTRCIEFDVIHAHPACAQLRCKVAHCRQHQRYFLGMMRHITAFGLHLGHQHHVVGHVHIAQRRQAVGQLIAQHQAQATAHRPALHRSEQ